MFLDDVAAHLTQARRGVSVRPCARDEGKLDLEEVRLRRVLGVDGESGDVNLRHTAYTVLRAPRLSRGLSGPTNLDATITLGLLPHVRRLSTLIELL